MLTLHENRFVFYFMLLITKKRMYKDREREEKESMTLLAHIISKLDLKRYLLTGSKTF